MVSDLLFSGMSLRHVSARVAENGGNVVLSTLSRHSRHIVAGMDVSDVVEPAGKKATNIEILEGIIQKGFANQKNWKPTISDTMKAMDMWFRLTQGNPFDELLDTLAAAATGDATDEDTTSETKSAVSRIDDEDSDG